MPRSHPIGFKIRDMNAECKFSQALTVEALSRAIPQDTIRAVLQQTRAGQTRERKLTLPVVVCVSVYARRCVSPESACTLL